MTVPEFELAHRLLQPQDIATRAVNRGALIPR
jgi:hypothetical protein